MAAELGSTEDWLAWRKFLHEGVEVHAQQIAALVIENTSMKSNIAMLIDGGGGHRETTQRYNKSAS